MEIIKESNGYLLIRNGCVVELSENVEKVEDINPLVSFMKTADFVRVKVWENNSYKLFIFPKRFLKSLGEALIDLSEERI